MQIKLVVECSCGTNEIINLQEYKENRFSISGSASEPKKFEITPYMFEGQGINLKCKNCDVTVDIEE